MEAAPAVEGWVRRNRRCAFRKSQSESCEKLVVHGVVAVNETVRAMFAEATAAANAGDSAKARALLESVVALLEPEGVWNSLLLTYRELAAHSLARQEQGQAGMLRSAALRGLYAARHVLRLSYAAAASREPEVAAPGLAFLRVTVKNYARLLGALGGSAAHEYKAIGRSAWIFSFESGPNPGYLAREFAWIVKFLEAAAGEGFSLDAARSFMRQGLEFVADENSFCLAPTPSSPPN